MQTEYAILIVLGILLIVSSLVKSVLERVGIPPLVGYILLGFLTSVANQYWSFFTVSFDNTFSLLAQLGVVALLFRVGLKSHTKELLQKLPDASIIWLGNVVTSLLFGFVVAYYLLSLSLETSLVIATALSATSVAVSVAVWNDAKRLNTSKGQLLLDVAELDDLSAVLLLSLLLAVIPVLQGNGESLLLSVGTTTAAVLVKLVIFIAGCYLFSHYLELRFTHLSKRWNNSKTGLTISILGVGLTIAAIAGLLGFSLAIGALFAGLAFSRDPQAVHTDGKFSYFYEFLTPFFFIYIGMQLNPTIITASLGLAAILLVPAVLGKLIGVILSAKRIVSKHDAVLLGLSMVPRAEIAMVIVYQCHQLSSTVVPDKIFSAMVIVAVVTSIIAPLLLRSMLMNPTANSNK